MNDHPRASNERGSSLIELVIGAVLILAIVGPVVTLCVQNSRSRALNGELAMAFSACRNNLESVRAMPFAEVPLLDGTGFGVPGPDGVNNGLNALPGDADGLPGTFVVTTEQTFGTETLYRVRAVVTWQGVAGEQEFALDALIADREVPH